MNEQYIPPAALSAAREVLAAQCTEVSAKYEHHWPALVWRAAIKEAIHVGNSDSNSGRADGHPGISPGIGPVQGNQGEL